MIFSLRSQSPSDMRHFDMPFRYSAELLPCPECVNLNGRLSWFSKSLAKNAGNFERVLRSSTQSYPGLSLVQRKMTMSGNFWLAYSGCPPGWHEPHLLPPPSRLIFHELSSILCGLPCGMLAEITDQIMFGKRWSGWRTRNSKRNLRRRPWTGHSEMINIGETVN